LAQTERQKLRRGTTGAVYRREATVGARTNEREGSSFIPVHCVGGNAGLCKEGEKEVTARHSGRATGAHARIARHNSDVAVAAALRGGDAEDVCPYAVGTGELARGWRWTGPRGKQACASTPSLVAWHRHHGGQQRRRPAKAA
jgi:hypothetical protein